MTKNGTKSSNQESRIKELEAQLVRLIETLVARNQSDNDYRFFKRMAAHQPPQYNGEPDASRFVDWIARMEKLLDVICCPENLKVKFAAFYLSGPAEMWWETRKATMTAATWEEFVKTLRERFYPPFLQFEKMNEFLCLEQNNMSVFEYDCKFNELSRFATEIVKSPEDRASRFYEGLNLEIKKGVWNYSDFQDLYDRALKLEMILNKEDNANKRKFDRSYNSNNKKFKNW